MEIEATDFPNLLGKDDSVARTNLGAGVRRTAAMVETIHDLSLDAQAATNVAVWAIATTQAHRVDVRVVREHAGLELGTLGRVD
ncbi:hypothetical protein BG46_03385 [Brucella anthropi]|uniref:hypothetical protein n=1 Tax=Brucella anthropi TaxID=529 RepID=UPI0004515DF6|nr:MULTISPECIES: hypothetical protein [Brucella]EXL08599.1 hypothetical protein BG46_03385 [Brucella anthropi]WKT93039.1 hypothetical protein QYR01_04750 [Brucella anthropi]